MKNNIFIQNKFKIYFGMLKSIKKIGKYFFLNFINNYLNIKFVIKNINLNIKSSIIGIYGIINKYIYIYEICFYNYKINKINNLYLTKSKIIYFINFFFFKLGYFYLETPLIENFQNSGSKQFLIIDKNKKGNFFSLSQSPQKIKQYYMFNNINKYFQITKCFRDEDNRSSRSKEFNQIDVENNFTSFVVLKKIFNNLIKFIYFYFVKKKIFILTIKYKYVKKFFFEKKKINYPYIYKKLFFKNNNIYIFKTLFFLKKKINKFFFILSFKKYFILLTKNIIDYNICYYLEILFKYFNIINIKIIIIWLINFSYFKKNKINHHQFTSFKNFFLNIFKSKSLAYDIIINGVEIGGGSIRNINFKIQKKIFFFLKQKKSFFLNFYKRSLPQHCGIALGLERFLSKILNLKFKKITIFNKFKKKINSIKL